MTTTPPPTNITSRGRRRRALSGLVALVAGAGLTMGLYPRAIPWAAGLLTFPLFLFAMVGLIQALTGT